MKKMRNIINRLYLRVRDKLTLHVCPIFNLGIEI